MQVNLSICHQSKIASALETARQTDLTYCQYYQYCQYYPIPVFWRLSSPAQMQPETSKQWDVTAL